MSVKISAADVKKLRETTGAGMMDCKNALVEAEGDFDKAIEILRKKGQKIAAKRADRESTEGVAITKISEDNTYGVAIVLACETDFVAKNDSFKQLASEFVDVAFNCKTKEEFLAADFGGIPVPGRTNEVFSAVNISPLNKSLTATTLFKYENLFSNSLFVGLTNFDETISEDIQRIPLT